MSIRIGSLCSGYGGLDLGVQAVLGGTVAWHAENDSEPSRILDHHWPGVANHGDIKATDWHAVEPVDVLTAGYPCQPFSLAGKRKGADDPRHLWPDVARAVGVLRPRLVVLENVAGHVALGLADVVGELSDLGYDATWTVVRAADAGAPHLRARLFVVAADTRGQALGLGTGLRPSDEAGLRGRRPDHDGAQATAADADVAGLPDGLRAGGGRAEPGRGGAAQRRGAAAADPCGDGCGRCQECDLGAPGGLAAPRGHDADRRSVASWGAYGPAIERWERVVGRAAPDATELGRNGQPRLSPAFVEWMMGLELGHVTDPAIGITRNAQLRALGNGVVPQQAELALQLLLPLAAAS